MVRIVGRVGIKGAFSHLRDEHEPSPLHLRRLKSQHHDFSSSTIHPPPPPLLMALLPRRALGHPILLPHTSSDCLVALEAQGFLSPPSPPLSSRPRLAFVRSATPNPEATDCWVFC